MSLTGSNCVRQIPMKLKGVNNSRHRTIGEIRTVIKDTMVDASPAYRAIKNRAEPSFFVLKRNHICLI